MREHIADGNTLQRRIHRYLIFLVQGSSIDRVLNILRHRFEVVIMLTSSSERIVSHPQRVSAGGRSRNQFSERQVVADGPWGQAGCGDQSKDGHVAEAFPSFSREKHRRIEND